MMSNKNTILIVLAVIIIGVGAWMVTKNKTVEPVDTNTNTQQSNAKINIDEVCRGALVYMSFPDGASAEAFVQECKEGKHPDVIDRYKASLNIDGAAI